MPNTLYRHFTSSEQLNAQYDIEASVADFADYVQQFIARSKETRASVACQLNIAYGPTRDETFDLFSPAPTSEQILRPAVFFVHGGYWRATTSKEWSYVAKGLSELGIVTIVENYTLSPRVSIAEIIRQHRAAFSFLWHNAERFGIDRQRIVIVGHSAGAHGIAELLATDWVADYGLPAQPYQGAIAISGLYDLRPLPHTFLAQTLDFTWQSAEALSPILHIPTQLPPLMLPYGLNETAEFQRQTVAYAQACGAQGHSVDLLALERDHFDILDEFFSGEGPLVQRVCQWLRLETPGY